jgi:CheY-like chemotaxis protein
MKNVLIVDDEKPFLLSLVDGLSSYDCNFNVLTAENGKKAVDILKTVKIDLLITDLNMPVMNGFELLSHMSSNCTDVPVIVMTAYASPEIEERLRSVGIFHYVEKPIDLEKLAANILEELAEGSEGHIRGITLPAFLQLVEMERKTCTLRITSRTREGSLYFAKGELVDAETKESRAEEAAYDIACWENPKIQIESICRKRKKNITTTLNHILMEAFRLKDEKERRAAGETEEGMNGEGELAFHSLAQKETTHLTKEEVMALEKHLQALKEIKGYKAAGIMNFTGEMLASDSSEPGIDLSLVGATFNDIFRSAHEASRKIGLDACSETVISTPKGIVVMRCSGVDAKAHVHLIGIMAGDGNQALMKMQIEKMVPAVVDEVA